jgi:predicted transcriptional regulator
MRPKPITILNNNIQLGMQRKARIMNNLITEIIQKVACRVPMIQPQEHLITIPNLKTDKTFDYISELRDFTPTPRT